MFHGLLTQAPRNVNCIGRSNITAGSCHSFRPRIVVAALTTENDPTIATIKHLFHEHRAFVTKQMGQIRNEVGLVKQVSYGAIIGGQEGSVPSQPLDISSTFDLAQHMHSCLSPAGNGSPTTLHILKCLTLALVKEDVAASMLRRIANDIANIKAKTNDQGLHELAAALQSHPYVTRHDNADDEVVDIEQLRNFTIQLRKSGKRHQHLIDTLDRLRMFLECNTLDEKIAMLQSAHGPGVCMALFLSSKTSSGPPNKAVAIAKYGHVMCGQHSVDMDVRGNVMMIGDTASIWVGEFKGSGNGYRGAKAQLITRLKLLEWALRVLNPNLKSIAKTGKVYMPRAEIRQGQVSQRLRDDTLIMLVGL